MKAKEEYEKLLVIVDMVNGFIKEGKMSDPYIYHITPWIIGLVEKQFRMHEGVAFIKDAHGENCTEFKKFPVHCKKGTLESELIDELKPYEKIALVYEKNSTCTMYANSFINDLEKMKRLKEVIIVGCCSDICILNAAIPLVNYFDQYNKDVHVTVIEKAIETYNSLEHNREEYNEMALKLMKQAGVRIK